MKLTIIKSDDIVYKDGVSYSGIDLSSAPENVHALQWDNNVGWIEFKNKSEFCKPPNENIDALPDWANDALAKWDEAKASEEAAAAAAEAAAAQVATQVEEPSPTA